MSCTCAWRDLKLPESPPPQEEKDRRSETQPGIKFLGKNIPTYVHMILRKIDLICVVIIILKNAQGEYYKKTRK
jgi:hypothetical protein